MGIKNGKPCKKCGNFDYLKSGECRICKNKKAAERRKSNPEKVREKNRKYYLKNRGKSRVDNWTRNNPEKAKAAISNWNKNNRDRKRELNRRWRKNNPDKLKANRQKRRARKSKAGGSFTAHEWRELCMHYDYRCLGCGKKFNITTLTADHVLPIALGGSSNIENIQPLCVSCNCSKGAKYIDYRPRGKRLEIWKQKSLNI